MAVRVGVAQERVSTLAQECAELTTAWHGRPNYSAVYDFLMEVSELVAPYRFSQVDSVSALHQLYIGSTSALYRLYIGSTSALYRYH